MLFLGLTSLVTDISSEMVTATLPQYLLLTLRLAPLQFGLIDGLNQGASGLVRVASGLIADRWQRVNEVATAGYAFSAVCRLGLLLVGRSWVGLSGVVLLDRKDFISGIVFAIKNQSFLDLHCCCINDH